MELITDTFIKVAPDSKVSTAEIPLPRGGKKTIPLIQYELLIQKPYALTLEDLMVATHVAREGLTSAEAKAQSEEIHAKLFSKPYPCMRASMLPKKYGWGVHHDAQGLIALYAVNSDEYRKFASGDRDVNVFPAMRSKRE